MSDLRPNALLRIVEGNPSALRLDYKALSAMADALRFQLADWRARPIASMDEDALADLQNDIGYLEILLSNIEDERRRR